MRIRTLGCATIATMVLAGCGDKSPTPAEPTASAGHDHPGANAAPSGSLSVAGGFTVERLARGSFIDDVTMTFKLKLSTATKVVHVNDPSDAVVARITVQPGGSLGWHTHHGPVIVTVASGTMSIINASDCVRRNYPAGKAFLDPGQGNVHVGFNDSATETVLYATFLDVPAGQPATIPADPACS